MSRNHRWSDVQLRTVVAQLPPGEFGNKELADLAVVHNGGAISAQAKGDGLRVTLLRHQLIARTTFGRYRRTESA